MAPAASASTLRSGFGRGFAPAAASPSPITTEIARSWKERFWSPSNTDNALAMRDASVCVRGERGQGQSRSGSLCRRQRDGHLAAAGFIRDDELPAVTRPELLVGVEELDA